MILYPINCLSINKCKDPKKEFSLGDSVENICSLILRFTILFYFFEWFDDLFISLDILH